MITQIVCLALSFVLGALSYKIAADRKGDNVVESEPIDCSGLDESQLAELQQEILKLVETYLEKNAKK